MINIWSIKETQYIHPLRYGTVLDKQYDKGVKEQQLLFIKIRIIPAYSLHILGLKQKLTTHFFIIYNI